MINWKRYLLLVILFLCAIFLQYGFFNNLGWGVLCPQLLIFFPIFGGLLEGSKSGLICGVIIGLIQDLIIGRFIGLNILVWGVTGFILGIFSRRFFKENYLIPIVAVILCMVFTTIFYSVLVGLISGYWFSFARLGQIMLGGCLANGILAPIIYLPAYRSISYGWLRKKHLEEENL